MAGRFKPASEIERQQHDWGHRHPNQEEVIYVLEGQVEQWVEREHRLLGPGDAVVIPAAAVLSPCVGEPGYEVEELAAGEPWHSLRGGA